MTSYQRARRIATWRGSFTTLFICLGRLHHFLNHTPEHGGPHGDNRTPSGA